MGLVAEPGCYVGLAAGEPRVDQDVEEEAVRGNDVVFRPGDLEEPGCVRVEVVEDRTAGA